MKRNEIKTHLYEKYIVPTVQPRERYIGIEVEMPVVNLSGGPVDFAVPQQAAAAFIQAFGFEPQDYDDEGVCYTATHPENGDNISFDCSYNNLELSLGREKLLGTLEKRFQTYVSFLNQQLGKSGYILTGMGINPHYTANSKEFLHVERYRMLERYLQQYRKWKVPMYFHRYPDYPTYASASQVQLDVRKECLIPTIKAFSLVEPVKAVLFNNSCLPEEPELLCTRDMMWENSTHGINPHNIGMFEHLPESEDELLEYISTTSIFCTERDGHYIHFQPIPIIDYLERSAVEGEYYADGTYHTIVFQPEEQDLKYLRSYKFEDLTYRGTIEFRSVCCQPFRDVMTVAAFHAGLMNHVEELAALLEQDTSIYQHGYSASELRKILNRREWPEFIDRDGLKQLCLSVLDLACEGLQETGFGEEHYLKPLYERAMQLTSPGRHYVDALDAGVSQKQLILEYASLD
ncbi:MAG: glutamylcysteine synthetase [Eubacteriales bacterium]|nr:glutamylcysteine synthetase [Eubacteriales bacterium]